MVLFDNLSKPASETNLRWLQDIGSPTHLQADIRDRHAVDRAVAMHSDADLILHLAGQVAVTSSLKDPRTDFEANALGTLNVLEAMREHAPAATLIFSSTNKVYGGMEDLSVCESDQRYSYQDLPFGIDESRPLDFHSPYGCSKGAADQYVRDYARIYGLRTVVFRQSCIYGPRQFGVEDQGWIAWFTIAAQLGREITVYGDGNQMRDVLYIDDLIDAFDAAQDRIETVAGKVYNVGGGCDNTLSLCELLAYLKSRLGTSVDIESSDWRAGDQRVYVSDVRRAAAELGWKPQVSREDGLGRLYNWVAQNLGEFH